MHIKDTLQLQQIEPTFWYFPVSFTNFPFDSFALFDRALFLTPMVHIEHPPGAIVLAKQKERYHNQNQL
jgi:hypothetical protein